MWDKLYARKSFHRVERKSLASFKLRNHSPARTDLRNNCCNNSGDISCAPLLSGFAKNRELSILFIIDCYRADSHYRINMMQINVML